MKRFKSCFIMLAMMVFGAFIFTNNWVDAAIENFKLEGIETSTLSEGYTDEGGVQHFPFEDAYMGEQVVIKTSNQSVVNSVSELTVTFNDVGEVSFDYLVSSEDGWDVFFIYVNGIDAPVVKESGLGSWKTFKWYNETNTTVTISVKYLKDVSNNANDDCVYLKGLSFNDKKYSPLLKVSVDGKDYTDDFSGFVYFDYNNKGVLSFSSLNAEYDLNDYTIEVKLNGEVVTGDSYSYNLKNENKYDLSKNVVSITYIYNVGEYRYQNFEFYYNAALSAVINGAYYELDNDLNNPFILTERGEGENKELVIASTNKDSDTSSKFSIGFEGSGQISFDYLVSGKKDFDFIRIYTDGVLHTEVSGVMEEFSNFTYSFYGSRQVNVITIEYYKSENQYVLSDENAIYLKNISVLKFDYVDAPSVSLDGKIVENDEIIVLSGKKHAISFGDMSDSIDVNIYLNHENENGEMVDEVIFTSEVEEGEEFTGNKKGPHAFVIGKGLNTITISFSAENSVSRTIVFYVVEEEIDDVFIFDNDEQYPFVRAILDKEIVIKTNIEGEDGESTSISYTSTARGELTIEYMVSSESVDYFIVSVNGEEVLKDSGYKPWQLYTLELKVGDVVTLTYSKDYSGEYGDDCVYFKNIEFAEKNYAAVVDATINDVLIDENTEVIYFDLLPSDSALRIGTLGQHQSVVVELNGVVVDAIEGIYDLSDKLQQNNVIVITFNQVDPNGLVVYNPVVYTFEYNARLINSEVVGYNPTVDFQTKNVNGEVVVALNSNNSLFNRATLELKVTGKGFFKLSYKYFTYDNLNVSICFDDYVCEDIIDEDNNDTWTTLGYSFENDGNHLIEVIVNSQYFYDEVDYLYLKDFEFYYFSTLNGKISGEGKEENPYDFSELISEMEKIGLYNFAYRVYNYVSLSEVYLNNLDGYSFSINGKEIAANEGESKFRVALSNIGENIILISNGNINITIYCTNEGLAGTTITIGFGSEEKPYEIYNATQFNEIREGLQYCYKLMDNITLEGKWSPLGTEEVPFTGCINGNNKTISGLNVEIDSELAGLIGYGYGAKVYDLTVENPVIKGTNFVGTIFAMGYDMELSNIVINNLDLSVISGENNDLAAGGVAAGAVSSNFYNVHVSGSVTSLSNIEAYVGGFLGGFVEGTILNSSAEVDVVGYGYVGLLIGFTEENVEINNVVVSGNVSSNNADNHNLVGIVSTDIGRIKVVDVKHKVSGTYTVSGSLTVENATLYGMGLREEGFALNFDNNSFSVDVVLTSGNELLDGVKAGINGYVIRFEMSDGSYRYYELFDIDNYSINSKDININIDSLTRYENNFASMEVEEGYLSSAEQQSASSVYVTVTVDNVTDLLHLRYIVNYGIPTTFNTYYVYGIYSSTISFLFGADLELDDSYSGLGNSHVYPYKGLISGGEEKHTIKFNINKPNKLSVGLINYYSSGEINPKIENIVIKGNVTGGMVAGLVGYYNGREKVSFINIDNYAIFNASEATGSLVGYSEYSRIHVENCTNYSEFDTSVFVGESSGSVDYSGTNKNFGEYKGEAKNSINMIFFGTTNVTMSFDAKLENYYVLDVKAEGITLTFKEVRVNIDNEEPYEGAEYTSDQDGKIMFVMSSNDLYKIIISGGLLKEKEYVLNTNFRGELFVPKSITLIDNNKLHSDGNNNWDLKANVTYYGDTTDVTTLTTNLGFEELNGNELVLKNVQLMHETYVVEDIFVDLTRYTDNMIKYKNLFVELNETSTGFKEIAQEMTNIFNSLDNIYNGEESIVSEDSISQYNAFIESNNIGNDVLNEWLEKIVNHISIVGNEAYVTYGQEATLQVIISYMNGTYEYQDIAFDYAFEDIIMNNEDMSVKLTSIDNFVSRKGTKVVYDQKIETVVELVKKEVTAKLEVSSFEYSGEKPSINVYLDLGDNKFSDQFTLEYIFFNSQSEECTPINIGSYAVSITEYTLTNSQFYDVLDLSMDSLIITPKTVDIVWNEESESYYNGQNKFGMFSAYYIDLNGQEVTVTIDEVDMTNAGTYTLNAIITDENYIGNEATMNKVYTIKKLDVQLEIGEYSINYGASLDAVSVVVSGTILSSDNQGTYYSAVKNDLYYDINDDLDSGTYTLIPSFNNEENLVINYNINKINGSLTVIGIDTRIVAEDRTYQYTGVDYSADSFSNKIYDINDNLVFDRVLRYEYTKDGVSVNDAIDVGTYTVTIIFDGNDNYNPSQKTITLTITPYIASAEWVYSSYESDYDGTDKLNSIKVYYYDVNGSRQEANLNISRMVDAGEYELIASIDDDNYKIRESSSRLTYKINKIDLSLSVGNYTMDYHSDLPSIEVAVEGLLAVDDEGVTYKIIKNNVEFDAVNPLDSGLYILVPVLNNEDDILVNYNINKTNGSLEVEGVETRIEASDIYHEYNGNEFVIDLSEVEVYDVNNTKVENPTIEYTITQDGKTIESVINVGTYNVTLLFVGNQNYGYCEKTISLIITPRQVEVVWEGTYESDYTGEDKFVGLTAYYIDLNDEQIYVDIAPVEIIDAGEYTLNTNFSDSNYTANEATKNKIYKVNKLDVNIEIGSYSINYGEQLPNININVTGLLAKEESTVTYNIMRNNNVYDKESVLDSGVYNLVGILSNEEELKINYNINKVNGTLTIVGVETEIVSGDFTHKYNGYDFVVDLSNVEVYDVNDTKVINPTFTYIIRQAGVEVLAAKDVGEYTLEIYFEGQGRYAASSLIVDLVIIPSELKIKINNASSEYGDVMSELTYTLVEGDLFNYDNIDVILTKEEGNEIGKYVISGLNNNPNYNVEFIDGEYEITKRFVTIAIDDKSSAYFDSIVELTYTVFDGSILSGDDLNIVLTKEEGTDAGVYSISGTYSNDLYNVTFIPGVYSIEKIDMTGIEFNYISKTTYDGECAEFGVSTLELSDGTTADVEYYFEDGTLATDVIDAGVYNIIARLTNKNYNTLQLKTTFIINKADIILEFENRIVVEYEEEGYNYEFINKTMPDGSEAEIQYIVLKGDTPTEGILGIGEYMVIAKILESKNYNGLNVMQTVKVVKKQVTIEYSTDTLVYNGNEQYPEFENSSDYILTFNTLDGSAPIDAGTYVMTVSHPNSNYVINNTSVEYTIEKLAIVLGAKEAYEYTGQIIDTNIEITNKVTNDDVKVSFEYYLNNIEIDQVKDAGEYTIKVVSLSGESAHNYIIEEDEFALKVNPKRIIVKPVYTSKVYGAAEPDLKYTLSEELYGGLQVSGSLTREEGEDAGTYLFSVENLVATSNYEFVLAEGYRYFYIIAKEIEVEVGETVFEYDGTEKRAEVVVSEGATVEYEGDMVNVGTYIVKIKVTNNNYRLPMEYEDIVITITKKNISSIISIDKTEYIYNGGQITPTISCGNYTCEITYKKESDVVTEIRNPGVYNVIVLIENETEKGEVKYKLTVNKMASQPKQVSMDIHYNRIIVENDETLEYKLDNGEYYSSNEFNGLRTAYKYTISVRRKETAYTAASEPIVYEVYTTNNPSAVHGLIDRLTTEINEENLKLLKEINKEMNKVNQADVDINKYGRYKEIKKNFETVINSYEENLENSHKVFGFIEGKVILFNLIVSLAAFVVLKRRINNI